MFEGFFINSIEYLTFMGLENSEATSEFVCVKCFQTIVDFDAYRKRCQKAQRNLIENKIQEIEKSMENEGNNFVEEMDQNFELIEEHLEEDAYEMYKIEQSHDNLVEEENLDEEIQYRSENNEIIIKSETKKKLKTRGVKVQHLKTISESLNSIKVEWKAEEFPKRNVSSTKGSVICEFCGNKFTNRQGLRTHKKNVHLIGSTGEIFQCDICSKIRFTKRSLFNHMRNVHRVQKVSDEFLTNSS